MRIVSGTCKGRVINPPKALKARPTTDFAKENLFNILTNRIEIENIRVLDIFSGSGSISYEFASRGAKQVVSVEKDPIHQSFIRQCSATLGLKNILSVKSNAFVFIKHSKESFDLIFADPPYDLQEADNLPQLIFESTLLNDDGVFILEHSKSKDFSSSPHFQERRAYGSVNFSFFSREQNSTNNEEK
ncbi:MAG: RsmD family RNA methyltransferase [Rikenellaceae bacterium]